MTLCKVDCCYRLSTIDTGLQTTQLYPDLLREQLKNTHPLSDKSPTLNSGVRRESGWLCLGRERGNRTRHFRGHGCWSRVRSVLDWSGLQDLATSKTIRKHRSSKRRNIARSGTSSVSSLSELLLGAGSPPTRPLAPRPPAPSPPATPRPRSCNGRG